MTMLPLSAKVERNAEVERLTERGCAVLCLDCPEGMLFGVDYAAWSVGPKFMGIKLVPPGLHYIYSSASASEDVGISRVGFFLYMRQQEVAVFRWDPETEELRRPDCPDEEARYADGVRGFDFDQNLGPYPLELRSQWEELTRHATAELLQRIEPVAKAIRSKRAEYDLSILPQPQEPPAEADDAEAMEVDNDASPEAKTQNVADEPKKEQSTQDPSKQDEATLESNAGGSGCLFFTSIPRRRKKEPLLLVPKKLGESDLEKVGSTPAETTLLHMDRSGELEEMITKEYAGNELAILGELQLSYIAFLLGQNYDGYEQWRNLLRFLCSCEEAATRRSELFSELCRTFFAQLSQAPSDLFGDDLTRDNFLGNCAVSLIEICDAESVAPKVRRRVAKLRELVTQKFGLSTEDLALLGEDAPQIVDEDGRDLVNFDLQDHSLTALD